MIGHARKGNDLTTQPRMSGKEVLGQCAVECPPVRSAREKERQDVRNSKILDIYSKG